MLRRQLACAALFLAGAFLSPSTALAACPSISGAGSLDAAQARAHIAWIDTRLTVTGRSARIWAWSWGGGIAASGVASLAAVPFVSRSERIDWYTSAGSAAVGVLPFVVAPLAVMHDAKELHGRVASLAPKTPDDEVCALLADAEAKLVRDAQDERSQQRWYVHVGNLAFNTGVLLFLGLGYHRWESGLINGLAGAAVGEALILTQPDATIEEAAAYEHGAAWAQSPPTVGYGGRF